MKEGTLVKYREPLEEGEENLVMEILEDRIERKLVRMYKDTMFIPATWNVRTSEIVKVK